MTEFGIYVYGLVAGGALAAAPEVPGVDGTHDVECVQEGEVCALVSKVSLEQFEEKMLREHLADMGWIEQTARRHHQVLDAVLAQCTPVPMRLCTLYSDERGLRRMLDGRQEDLSAALRELRGKLEWGVQAYALPRRETTGANRPAASGTAYLQQKLADRHAGERVDAQLDELCERLHAELCAVSLAGRLGMPQRAEVSGRELPMVLNASYLVPNTQRAQFQSRFRELRDELAQQRLELQLTGPWPPYNFVTAEIGGGR